MNGADRPLAATTTVVSPPAPNPLPAQKRDPATGQTVIDYRAVAMLALPLMLNSSLQAVISLTDTWFVGHISTTAMAGMAAVYWVVLLFLMLVGGVGLAVQTFVAQAEGSRRRMRASHATWVALTASALTLPFFALLAWSGPLLFAPFGLPTDVSEQAMAFWQPRMLGAPVGVALWAVLGFFNGISRPRIAVMTTGLVATINAALNWLFIFKLDGGIAGSAWATNVSMVCGLAFALWVFLGAELRAKYKSHLTWRPDLGSLARQYRLGLPMGAMYAADLFGMALFQLMQVRLSSVDGAATQIIMMLTSMSYMPGIGIALAGTTLVGQSIGAGDHAWARRLGNAIIVLTVAFMGTLGVLVALAGPWLLPTFMDAADPQSADGRGNRRRAAVDRRRIPDLRRPQPGQRVLAARRGGRARAGDPVLRAGVGRVRATRAFVVVRAGPGLGQLPAAVRVRRGGRLDGHARLRRAAGHGFVPAVAVGSLGAHPPLIPLPPPLPLAGEVARSAGEGPGIRSGAGSRAWKGRHALGTRHRTGRPTLPALAAFPRGERSNCCCCAGLSCSQPESPPALIGR